MHANDREQEIEKTTMPFIGVTSRSFAVLFRKLNQIENHEQNKKRRSNHERNHDKRNRALQEK